MRALAKVAGRELGVPVVVENKPGAGGVIALGALLTSPHDGYTVMQLPITVYRLPYLQNLSFDPARDIAPILQISAITFGVVVEQHSRFSSFQEIVAFARATPGKLVIGSTGYASTPHLVMADLFAREGIDYIHVPFKGATDQILSLQSGTIMVGVVGTGYAPFVDKGQSAAACHLQRGTFAEMAAHADVEGAWLRRRHHLALRPGRRERHGAGDHPGACTMLFASRPSIPSM